MLTRFVRTQLVLFTIASIVGVAVMVFAYIQLPTLLGIGRLTVTMELPASGGLYQFANVTYRGVQIGKVREVRLTENGAEATLSLDTSPKVPADLQAEVRSVSAVGEQYVDLRPRTDSGPYLEDGSRIARADTTIPQQVGPMLDQLSALVDSLPKDRIPDLLDETFLAFNGAGPDFASLLDSASTVTEEFSGVSEETRALVDDSGPLLESQAETTDAIRTWARSLNGISAQVVQNDPELRSILQQGPGFAQEVSALLNDVKPTLPVLLANLTTVGQVLVTYNPSIEQLLVLFPGIIAAQQSFGLPQNNPTGLPSGDFALTISDPNPCTVGFLPPSRGPDDHRHPGRFVLQAAAGFAAQRPRCSQLSVYGPSRQACSDRRTVQRPERVRADDHAAAHPWSVPLRPEPDRPGHPARRPG